jgi:hypothetical protein
MFVILGIAALVVLVITELTLLNQGALAKNKLECGHACWPYVVVASVDPSCSCANGSLLWRKDIRSKRVAN